MLFDRLRRRTFRGLMCGVALGATLPPVYAQDPAGVIVPASGKTSAYCATPCAPQKPACETAPPPVTPPTTGTPPTIQPPQPSDAPPSFSPADVASGARGDEGTGFAAPNMIGNLLGAGNSVSFFVNRSSGPTFVQGTGSTSIINPNVAENNSPVPADRVYFRYNYFNNALSVVGLSSAPPFRDVQLGGFVPSTTTRNYNLNQYTFGAEKTFFDGMFSAELRVPITTSLSHNLDLNYGTITGTSQATFININDPNFVGGTGGPGTGQPSIVGAQNFNIATNPNQTLGSTDTEFGNMTLILKAAAYRNTWFLASGGASVGLPTAPDEHVRVTDYLGNPSLNNAETQRIRDFHTSNETVSIAPFIAFLATPTERFFTQGFMQLDVPLNSSTVTYSSLNGQQIPFAQTAAAFGVDPNGVPLSGAMPEALNRPFTIKTHIREQTLVHLDLGSGYWLYRDPNASWLTGIAPSVELHYTSALNNADIVRLPRDVDDRPVVAVNGGFTNPNFGAPGSTSFVQGTSTNATVGNLRNRIDILDLTLGSTFEFNSRATLATAVTVPLRSGDNKTFDWEFQVQLNYYFTPRAR